MEKKKSKKRRYRLFYLLLLLFITTITLSFSSYAWFTTNRLVKIDLLNVNVRAQGGIEISVDGTNWKSVLTVTDIEEARNNYPNSLNQVPSTLEPVSTVLDIENGKNQFITVSIPPNTSGVLKLYYNTKYLDLLFILNLIGIFSLVFCRNFLSYKNKIATN